MAVRKKKKEIIDNNKKPLIVYLTSDLYDSLMEMKKKTNLAMSAQINIILRRYFVTLEEENNGSPIEEKIKRRSFIRKV